MLGILGPLSTHMLQHIALMNVLAPMLVLLLRWWKPHVRATGWIAAAICQLVLLWGWHAPPAMSLVLSSPTAHLAMQLSLFGAALWFWMSVFTLPLRQGWQALFALLITGKLFCLLGALLIFAGRPVYTSASTAHLITVADQEMAGLMMIVACPLSYVIAGIVLSSIWFTSIERPRAMT